MPTTIDLGGAPAEEECAQLGQTTDFATVNTFEVNAYRIAMIARFGSPPEGCRFVVQSNPHDFGTYRTLALRVIDEPDEAVREYVDQVENGLARWTDGGLTPPVTYAGKEALIPRSDVAELIIGALHTCRPNAGGAFALHDFEVIHGNLTSAFPTEAAEAAKRIGAGWAAAEPKRVIFAYDVPVHVEVEGDRVVRVTVIDEAPIGDDPAFVSGDRDHFDAAVKAARDADEWPVWRFGY